MINNLLKQPYWFHAAAEVVRAQHESAFLNLAKPFIEAKASSDADLVLVIPGFLGDDNYTAHFRGWLRNSGFQATGWKLGRNLGPGNDTLDILKELIEEETDRAGEPINLIGHSLGGIYARELAKMMPHRVRQVISVGTPIKSDPIEGLSPVSRIFEALNPGSSDHWNSHARIWEAPPVPTSSLFSYSDGIVHWRRSIQNDGHDKIENIAVIGSHTGMLSNASVWNVIANRLSQKQDDWTPYKSINPLLGIPIDGFLSR